MELLKQLKEAQASGLSKEEYFHLLDMEFKLTANKKQVLDSLVNINGEVGEKAADLENCLQDIYIKLKSQQQDENQKLQQCLRDSFEQQKQQLQNQLQNLQEQLQRQQELQQRQLQQIQIQLQQQQENRQIPQEMQKELHNQQQTIRQLSQQNELYKKSSHESVDEAKTRDIRFEQAVQEIKDEFREMRNTVLNKLEEEKIFMRDALSKAQKDILTLLTMAGEDVRKVKEILQADILAGLEKQIGQVQQLCEDILQTLTKKQDIHSKHVNKKEKQVPAGRQSMFDAYNSDCFDSPFE